MSILEDGAVLASGVKPLADIYTVTLDVPAELLAGSSLAAVRLEALTDASLSQNGPGRTPHGNFVLTKIAVSATPLGATEPGQNLAITHGEADFEQDGFEAAGCPRRRSSHRLGNSQIWRVPIGTQIAQLLSSLKNQNRKMRAFAWSFGWNNNMAIATRLVNSGYRSAQSPGRTSPQAISGKQISRRNSTSGLSKNRNGLSAGRSSNPPSSLPICRISMCSMTTPYWHQVIKPSSMFTILPTIIYQRLSRPFA